MEEAPKKKKRSKRGERERQAKFTLADRGKLKQQTMYLLKTIEEISIVAREKFARPLIEQIAKQNKIVPDRIGRKNIRNVDTVHINRFDVHELAKYTSLFRGLAAASKDLQSTMQTINGEQAFLKEAEHKIDSIEVIYQDLNLTRGKRDKDSLPD